MFLTGVIYYQVKQNLGSAFMTSFDQLLHMLDSSVGLMNGAIIGNVVSHVALRAFKDRIKPESICAE